MSRGSQPRPIGLLYGLPAIAEYVGLTPQQAQELVREGDLPAFHVGTVICARRSTLGQHFAQLASRDLRERAPAPAGAPAAPVVIRGFRAIARHLQMESKAAQHLHNRRLLPSFRDEKGAPIATVAALDDYLALNIASRAAASEER